MRSADMSYLAGYPDRPPVTPGSATLPDYCQGFTERWVRFSHCVLPSRAALARWWTSGSTRASSAFWTSSRPLTPIAAIVRERMGPGTVNAVPHSHYPTADGKWVAIACTSDKIFQRLAVLMGRPELAGDGCWGTSREARG